MLSNGENAMPSLSDSRPYRSGHAGATGGEVMSEDWMEWLTEEERGTVKFAANQSTAVFGSAAIFAWAHTVAASRALVAEKDKALRNYGVHMTGDCLGLRRECICSFSAALALTEEDMREWLEVK